MASQNTNEACVAGAEIKIRLSNAELAESMFVWPKMLIYSFARGAASRLTNQTLITWRKLTADSHWDSMVYSQYVWMMTSFLTKKHPAFFDKYDCVIKDGVYDTATYHEWNRWVKIIWSRIVSVISTSYHQQMYVLHILLARLTVTEGRRESWSRQ